MATTCHGNMIMGVLHAACAGLGISNGNASVSVPESSLPISNGERPVVPSACPRGATVYFSSPAGDGAVGPAMPAGNAASGGAGDGGRPGSIKDALPNTLQSSFQPGLFESYHRFTPPAMIVAASESIADFFASFDALGEMLDAFPLQYGDFMREAGRKAKEQEHPACPELFAKALMASVDMRDEFDWRWRNMRPTKSKVVFVFPAIDGELSQKDLFWLGELYIATNGSLQIDEVLSDPGRHYLYVHAPCSGADRRPANVIQDVIIGIIKQKDAILGRP